MSAPEGLGALGSPGGLAVARRLTGSMRQLARSELLSAEDGPARGSRVVRLSAANGFEAEVFPDRGMDLGAVSWRGIPLAWLSAAGPSAPGLIGEGTEGWNRGFGGGLLTTCGLDQFGSESVDGGVRYPQHGRAHALAAEHVATWSRAEGEDWRVGVSGRVRQATPFAENLALDREISVGLADGALRIRDRVTNEAHAENPHMILYHMNLGWPLIEASSRLSIAQVVRGERVTRSAVIARDLAAEAGLAEWDRFASPSGGFAEQVFRHALEPGLPTVVRVESPAAGIAAEIEFSTGQLPHLFQWRLLGEGGYVLGIEPANAPEIAGRAAARAAGALPVLAPGESARYELTLRVSPLP